MPSIRSFCFWGSTMEFNSEQHLVEAFVSTVGPDWTVYPETGNFDILLHRKADGFQVGIEAKLSLNTKVICQAADLSRRFDCPGPDCRAVLVPWTKRKREQEDLRLLLEALQIVVLRVGGRAGSPWVSKGLPAPAARPQEGWPEHFPASRIVLPDYIPDVAAGVKGPVKLTHWKVRAIRLVILLRRRGYIVRSDFGRLGLSPSIWTQRGWLINGPVRGQWIEGTNIPDFESQHPVNFKQIMDDFENWNLRDLEGYI